MKKIKQIENKPHTVLEAYAIKVTPPEQRDNPLYGQYGLPIFVRDRETAVNETAVMISHLNIRSDSVVITFLGRYDINAGVFSAPLTSEIYVQNFALALSDIRKGEGSHEKEK